VFLIQSSSKRSEADDLCTLPGGGCDSQNQQKVNDLDADADSAATLGIVGLVVGGIGVATGVTLLVLSSGGSSDKAALHPKTKQASATGEVKVAPWFGRDTVGIKGTF
jgi:hypothetical protein